MDREKEYINELRSNVIRVEGLMLQCMQAFPLQEGNARFYVPLSNRSAAEPFLEQIEIEVKHVMSDAKWVAGNNDVFDFSRRSYAKDVYKNLGNMYNKLAERFNKAQVSVSELE